MKKLLLFTLLPVAFLATAFISDTCADFDFTEGTVMTMTTYDGKDKVQSVGTTTIKKITKAPTSTTVEMSTVTADDKGKEQGGIESSMTCSGGKMSMDLRNFVSPQLTKGGKDMTITVDGNMIDYPAGLAVGSTLPDATMVVHMASDGKEVSSTTIRIHDRKVEAIESKTTPAGTWNCIKITYIQEASMNMTGTNMNINIMKPMKAVEWFSYQVGTVRTEAYKNDKLESYSQLTALKKP